VEELFTLAQQTTRMAGKLLLEQVGQEQQVEHKGAVDLVTAADRRSEHAIVAAIRAAHPDHAILTEEGTSRDEGGALRWIVDPLDGTTNYAHGYPCFSVSIALEQEGRVVLGVVYDPVRDELFAARRGHGARLNGVRLSVSRTERLDDSLLATGFPYDIRTSPENNLAPFARFALRTQGVRRDGSAALDLCSVAAGRFDGFWEMKLAPWDVAAGSLIVAEASGRVSDYDGGPFTIAGRRMIASNGRIHEQMIAVLKEQTPTSPKGGA
jgi:myo-inositol-1(or 4)-monophosphatase